MKKKLLLKIYLHALYSNLVGRRSQPIPEMIIKTSDYQGYLTIDSFDK